MLKKYQKLNILEHSTNQYFLQKPQLSYTTSKFLNKWYNISIEGR